MSGAALGFMLVTWGMIAAVSFTSLRAVLKHKWGNYENIKILKRIYLIWKILY